MAEPMKNKQSDIEEGEEKSEIEKGGVIKRGLKHIKTDIKHGSRVEEGSLVDGVRKTFRSIFPKKR